MLKSSLILSLFCVLAGTSLTHAQIRTKPAAPGLIRKPEPIDNTGHLNVFGDGPAAAAAREKWRLCVHTPACAAKLKPAIKNNDSMFVASGRPLVTNSYFYDGKTGKYIGKLKPGQTLDDGLKLSKLDRSLPPGVKSGQWDVDLVKTGGRLPACPTCRVDMSLRVPGPHIRPGFERAAATMQHMGKASAGYMVAGGACFVGAVCAMSYVLYVILQKGKKSEEVPASVGVAPDPVPVGDS